jgi:diguanylate cyclase (GGDEF)-like protein
LDEQAFGDSRPPDGPGPDDGAPAGGTSETGIHYRALLELATAVATGVALADTLQVAARLAVEGLGAAWCDIFDGDPGGDACVMAACHHAADLSVEAAGWIGTLRHPDLWPGPGEQPASRRAQVVYRDDFAVAPAEAQLMERRGELARLSVPLVYAGEVVGVADVAECRRPRRWSDEDERYAQAIADLAAVAVAHARCRATLAEQAVTDELTGLSNFRHFMSQLRHEVAVCRRYGYDLSLLVVDLDDFRRYNQTFGRARGDAALGEVADILREATRAEVDIIARYARDEFLVILPVTRANEPSPLTAATVAGRIHQRVGEHRFRGEHGARDVALSASVGVAGIGLGGYSADELLKCAENALNLAKHEGKDRVVTFGA